VTYRYVIRDLHATNPDDEAPGVHDVLRLDARTNRVIYSEDVFDSAEQAQTYAERCEAGEVSDDHWHCDNAMSDSGSIAAARAMFGHTP
jgi:hypothetical protein